MSTIKCKEKDCDQEMANPCQDIVALLRLHIAFSAPLSRGFNPDHKNELKRQIEEEQKVLIEKGVPLIEDEVKANLTLSRGLENTRYFTLECGKKHRHVYALTC